MSLGGLSKLTKRQPLRRSQEVDICAENFSKSRDSSVIISNSISAPVEYINQATSVSISDDNAANSDKTGPVSVPRLPSIQEQPLAELPTSPGISVVSENRREGVNAKNKFFCTPVASASDPVHDFGDDLTQNSTVRRNRRFNSSYLNEIAGKGDNQLGNNQNPSSFISLQKYGYEQRVSGPLVKLNICGTPFIVKLKTLKKDPMVFERILDDAEWISETGEYYLERDPGVFRFVYSYLRYNEMHLPQNICGPLLEKELELWGLQLGFDLQRCCLGPVVQSKSNLESLKKFEKEFTQLPTKPSTFFGYH